jgi:TetR/AcrR family transcriptional regulator, regulator of cefoperazone and chloramphenicol sensitivity
MKKQRSDTLRTRLSLLEAANEIFAGKGFWNATFEEISHKANTNVASINYHFGSKENLYVEAWKYTFEKSLKKHPPDGGTLPSDPVEKRIQGRILSILERIMDTETHDLDIIHKEISNPTGLLFNVFSETVEPIDNAFKAIIREFLGGPASEELVDFCFNSIMSQCFISIISMRTMHKDAPIPPPNLKMLTMGAEKLADYIMRFIFHGINSFRQTSK